MRLHRTACAALVFLLAAPVTAIAQEPGAPAPLRSSRLAMDRCGLFSLAPPGLDLGGPVCVALAWVPRTPPAPPAPNDDPPRHDEAGYRERYRHTDERAGSSPLQVHGGFFDPNGVGTNSFAFGFRGGPAVDERIQLGVGLDWYHESQDQRAVVGQANQAGQPITVTRELARASSDLLPLMAFIQLNLGSGRALTPYAGIAGEYQVLFLSATDFQTGGDYNATFGGWGWQGWGGVALPLSSRSRLFGEAFYNSGEVGRDVKDPAGGLTFRESVDAGGTGMRFGLSWGF